MSLRKAVVGVLVLLCATTSLVAGSRANEALQPEFSIHLTPKTHVQITNMFEDGASLTLHCKSRDDDLGEHVVAFNTTYEIVFHPAVTFKTLFYCRLSSPHGWLDVDVYRQTRDWHRCFKMCMWIAQTDSFIGFDMLSSPDITYNWNLN